MITTFVGESLPYPSSPPPNSITQWSSMAYGKQRSQQNEVDVWPWLLEVKTKLLAQLFWYDVRSAFPRLGWRVNSIV